MRLRAALADRYAIERKLGEGGMAAVYLAHDLRHERKVAVKVLRPELAAVLGAERFVQEIKTTAALQHPHILPLFDSGEADGFLYYVMPYVEGETLRDKLNRETQLSIDEAVKVAIEVADALDYAHRHGVIHRDIKPENILLHDGRPMVADFGIALAVSAAAGGRMTETGLSMGTPHYMSPEQATAEKDLTNRSDIYSLGSVLYEMLTGDPPHTGSSAQQVIMKIVTEEAAPVTKLRKSVPANVAAAVSMALQQLPADRFESAKAFADALADPGFTGSIGGTAAVRGGSTILAQPRWTVAAAAALALVAGAAGWFLRPVPRPQRRPTRFAIQSDSAHTITYSQMAISPDGSVIVYQAATADGVSLFRRRLDELDGQPIPGTAGGFAPFFSPDGAQLGFSAAGALRRVALGGGTPLTITQYDGYLTSAVWSEAGEILFSTAYPGHVYRVSASGGELLAYGVLDSLAGISAIRGLHFVPGSSALFFSRSRGGTDTVYALTGPDDRSPRVIVPAAKAWSVSSGNLVYVTQDGGIVAQPFDPATLQSAEPTTRLAEGLVYSGSFTGMPAAVSPSGAVAYDLPERTGSELHLVDRKGLDRVVLHGHRFWVPRFSPDGHHLVFGDLGDAEGREDIWIHDLRGGTTSRITFDGRQNNDPVWSPDGRRIAFSRGDPTKKDVYVTSVGSGGEDGWTPDTLVAQDGIQWPSDWSPDGRLVVFTNVNEEGNYDIWGAPVDRRGVPRAYLAAPYAEYGGRVSPDGRWLAYQSDESGQFEVYVQSFPEPGHKQRISTNGGQHPMWARTGDELFYWNPGEQLMASRLTLSHEVTVRRRDVLFRFPGYVYIGQAQYDVSPDGHQFAIVRGTIDSRLIVALDAIAHD